MNIEFKCDLCKSKEARYDAKHVVYGYWGYMCPQCYKSYGSKTEGLFNVINKDVPDNNYDKKFTDSQFRLIAQAFGIFDEDDPDWDALKNHLSENQEALSQAVKYAIIAWSNSTPLIADKRGWVVYNERLNILKELL